MTELAALVLYDDATRMLLQRRTEDAPSFPGHWSFFRGGVEEGETPEEALAREALEELAYTVQAPRLWLTQNFTDQSRVFRQYVFVERYDGSALVLGEGQAMGWFLAQDTASLLMSDHARRTVEALGRDLQDC
jgi:8-oxo-dGTP diphosphatase